MKKFVKINENTFRFKEDDRNSSDGLSRDAVSKYPSKDSINDKQIPLTYKAAQKIVWAAGNMRAMAHRNDMDKVDFYWAQIESEFQDLQNNMNALDKRGINPHW